jgi:hypothetical protein
MSTEEKSVKIESNLCKCKQCGNIKLRIQQGKFNPRDKRWVDGDGKMWNGRKCPLCVREASRKYQIAKRKGF